MIPGFIRCFLGIHVLPLYPHKTREIGCHESYSHYICYRCGKEVIR